MWSLIGAFIGNAVGMEMVRRKHTKEAEVHATNGVFPCSLRLVEGTQRGLTGGDWRTDAAQVRAGRIRIEGHAFPVTSVDVTSSRSAGPIEMLYLVDGARIYSATGPTSRLELAVHPSFVDRLVTALGEP